MSDGTNTSDAGLKSSDKYDTALFATFPPPSPPTLFPFDAGAGPLSLSLNQGSVDGLDAALIRDVDGKNRLNPEAVKDILLLVDYEAKPS